ncbi:MAG: hypothetical protein HYV93_00430, partial [Candidatus Rokubacteria bacterium]|nr:hypothetical protein [Candidatus Rokubacteria bacterium]
MAADAPPSGPVRWKHLVVGVITTALSVAAGMASAPPAAAQWTATWTAKGWPASPPSGVGARGWIDLVFDEVAGRSVLFGGSGELYMNDVWFYDGAADTWAELEPSVPCWALNDHVPPTPRDEHAVEYDSFNRLYWSVGGSGFGCKGSARTADAGSGPTTLVDGALSSATVDFYKDWTVEVISTSQKAYVSGYDPVTKTLTLATPISGLTAGTQYYLYSQRGGGTWYYSPVTQTWGSLSGPHWGYTGPLPSHRYSPAMAYSPLDRAIVLFGGEPNDNDTWMLDVQTRSWVRKLSVGAPGSPPPLRQVTNSMVYDAASDVFVLFGGRCGPCATYESSDETWAYRLSTNSWTNLAPPLSPPARQQHTMVYDSDNGVIVLFGGNDSASGVHFNDLWIFDTAAGTWTQLVPPTSPPARRLHAMVYDPVNGVTVMYGGADAAGSRRDVWHLRLTRTGSGNPVPVLASLTPTSAAQGGGAFTLAVNGSNFVSTSVVRWNGADRPTTYVSATQLEAAIPASDLSTQGTAAVTVFTPAPGGGTSNALTFTITAPAAEIIVDNAGAGVQDPAGGRTFTGAWCVSGVMGFYGTDSLYSCGGGVDTYRWTPTIPAAGSYDVYVRWTAHANRSAAAPYTVVHAGGTTVVTENQQVNGGSWQLLGTFTFNAGTGGYLQLSDANGLAVADAVRWVPAGSDSPPGEIIVDNAGAGVQDPAGGRTFTGAWCVSGV